MRGFDLVEPSSLQEASQILTANEEARAVAGGTALLILVKQGVFQPTTLVNLKKTTGASGITFSNDGLRVGALTTIHELEVSDTVRCHYPSLAEACHVVANIRIRNMATIGGNLAHGDYQSDPPTMLVALDARVEITGPNGIRETPIGDFLIGGYETDLAPGELVSAVLVPPPDEKMRSTYLKFTTRSSEDRPCVGVAAMVRLNEDRCEDAVLVVGAATTRPVRVRAAEALARGQRWSEELVQEMAATAASAIDPVDDVRAPGEYRRQVTRVLAGRALTACANGTGVTA